MSSDSQRKSEPIPEWRELADQASREPDGHKVTELVRKICDTLDHEEAERRRKTQAMPVCVPAPSSDGQPNE